MTSTTLSPTAEFVKLGYGDSHGLAVRSLDFRTESMGAFATVSECLRVIDRYNAFDADRIIGALEPVFPDLMSVKIGRESSPVIYAEVPYWTHQRIGPWRSEHVGQIHPSTGMGQPLSEHERRAIATTFLYAMGKAGADEISHQMYGENGWTFHRVNRIDIPVSEVAHPPLDGKITTLRAWWD